MAADMPAVWRKYECVKILGEGSYGTVFLGVERTTRTQVAIKILKRRFKTWQECLAVRELKSLLHLRHTNVVKLIEVVHGEDKHLSMVFEFLAGNLVLRAPASVPIVNGYMRQLLEGLEYIHKHGYFHRDLKPDNLLLSSDGVLKIADFGLAREIRSVPPYTAYVSTRWYRAPELLLGSQTYSSVVDMWAVGCIMVELLTGKPLFPGATTIDQLSKIIGLLGPPDPAWREGQMLLSNFRGRLPRVTSSNTIRAALSSAGMEPAAIALVEALLQWDPLRRPSASEALSSAWFKNSERRPSRPNTVEPVAAEAPVPLPASIRSESPPLPAPTPTRSPPRAPEPRADEPRVTDESFDDILDELLGSEDDEAPTGIEAESEDEKVDAPLVSSTDFSLTVMGLNVGSSPAAGPPAALVTQSVRKSTKMPPRLPDGDPSISVALRGFTMNESPGSGSIHPSPGASDEFPISSPPPSSADQFLLPLPADAMRGISALHDTQAPIPSKFQMPEDVSGSRRIPMLPPTAPVHKSIDVFDSGTSDGTSAEPMSSDPSPFMTTTSLGGTLVSSFDAATSLTQSGILALDSGAPSDFRLPPERVRKLKAVVAHMTPADLSALVILLNRRVPGAAELTNRYLRHRRRAGGSSRAAGGTRVSSTLVQEFRPSGSSDDEQ